MTPAQLCLAAAILTALLVAALLEAHRREATRWVWGAKGLASLTFLGLAFALPAEAPRYALWIRLGLVAAFAGDLAMLRPGRAGLPLGLGAFLLTHLAYCVAIGPRVPPTWVTLALGLAALGGGVWVFFSIRPQLGQLEIPAAGYTVAVSATCAACLSAWVGSPHLAWGALVGVGGALFWISDVSVARQRFLDAGWGSKLWGLPCYYGGQLLLAASVSWA